MLKRNLSAIVWLHDNEAMYATQQLPISLKVIRSSPRWKLITAKKKMIDVLSG